MNLPFKQIYNPRQLDFTPSIGNLIFYNESDIFPNKPLVDIEKKLAIVVEEEERYRGFLKKKGRRPNYDIYACYQPFNESFKAIFPFLKALRKTIKKGDTILSLWDRTGWQTNLLAGLFPEQHIVATWDGNKDVLFCDLNKPLPIKNDSIAFSCGYDTFHNFDQSLLLDELFRVVKNDGAILFPHVHLTNSEPDPYFDRGCKQRHGTDYQTSFDHLAKTSSWQGYVFSEPELFKANDMDRSEDIMVVTNPDSPDYNATITLLPKMTTHMYSSTFCCGSI